MEKNIERARKNEYFRGTDRQQTRTGQNFQVRRHNTYENFLTILRKTKNGIFCNFRWWKDLGLAQELKQARNQPLKWYTWSMASLSDPSMSEQRLELTKSITFIYIIDDIFDLYGTPEELTVFTRAVHMYKTFSFLILEGRATVDMQHVEMWTLHEF